MLDKIIEKIDFKWWSSLEAQQKLTVGMAMIIVSSFGMNIYLFMVNEKNQMYADSRFEKKVLEKNIEIATESARADACYESQIIYLKENEKRYQELFFRMQDIKQKVNESDSN